MKVSVVIPHKKEESIIECVDSIQKSTYEDVEIITVCEGLERSMQRNIGAKRATGDFLLFLDADMYIHPELIAECVWLKCCPNIDYPDGLDALYIPEVIVGKGFWIKVRNFERSFYNGTCIDAIRFMKKDKFLEYDVALTGVEDWDQDRRFKGTKGITKHVIYHQEGQFSFFRYLKKKRYYSRWMHLYKKRYDRCDELSFTYRYWMVFMEGEKWKKSLGTPVLFLATLFLRLMVGVVYLCSRRKR